MTAPATRKTKLMTTADLAELLGVKPRTIERWRAASMRAAAGEDPEELGELGPPFMPFGGTIRYHPARVQAWMLAREQGTPSGSRGTPMSKGAPRGR